MCIQIPERSRYEWEQKDKKRKEMQEKGGSLYSRDDEKLVRNK